MRYHNYSLEDMMSMLTDIELDLCNYQKRMNEPDVDLTEMCQYVQILEDQRDTLIGMINHAVK